MNMQVPFGFPNMGMMAPFGVMNKMPLAPALYIGDLDESIQEETLYDFFSKFGAIHFVRIMRDTTTGKSRGYGFVNFINPRDAENAKQYAQYEKLGKKQIRIMFKRPIKDLTTEANVFVKNIDPNVTVRELHNHFMNTGSVICCKIATNSEGKSLGYGYVQFEKPEDAEKAMEALQNSQLKEKEISLSRFVPKEKRDTAAAKTNIYLKNLPSGLSKEELEKRIRDAITKFVPKEAIKTMLVKQHPTETKFCAFICFEDQASAQKAFIELKNNPTILDAQQEIYVNWHQNRAERERELKREYAQASNQTNLYVKNLKLEVTEEDIKKAFQNFGKVTSVACKEWVAPTGQKQAKFGFIAFDNADDAKRAVAEGLKVPEVRNLYLPNSPPYINLHQPKERRHEYLLSAKRRKMQSGMMPPVDMYNRGMPFPNAFTNRRFQPFQPIYPNQMKQMNRGGPRGGPKGGPNFSKGGPQQRTGPFRGNQGAQQGGNLGPQQTTQQKVPMKTEMGKGPQTNPKVSANPQASIKAAPVTVQSLRAKLNEFLALDDDKQRQILGELLFPLVRARAPENFAPKITGMLIDLSVLEVTEILEFLEDPSLLDERIQEASQLLIESGQ